MSNLTQSQLKTKNGRIGVYWVQIGYLTTLDVYCGFSSANHWETIQQLVKEKGHKPENLKVYEKPAKRRSIGYGRPQSKRDR